MTISEDQRFRGREGRVDREGIEVDSVWSRGEVLV